MRALRLALVVLALLGLPAAALAQTANAVVVSGCGTPPQTYVAGQQVPVTVDTNGNLCFNGSGGGASSATITPSAASSAALSAASSTSLGTSLVVKASAGNLYGAYATAITGTGAGYLIAYNGTTAPSTGALTGANVLDSCYFSGPAGCSLNYIPTPVNYSTGIVLLISSASTPFTYTTGVLTGYLHGAYK